jgi:hypothetical protein
MIPVVSEQENDAGVLSSLPSTRPQRRSPKRAADAAKPPGATPKPRSAATPRPAAKPKPPPIAEKAAQGFEPEREPVEPPSSTEILASAVQTAGELAQIGVTLGEQLLRAIAKRLPKP